jgi:hypothetical protein
MLSVSIRRVRPEHLNELRQWFKTVNEVRREEALVTLEGEACRHEQAYLLSASEGPLLLQIMEVEHTEWSRRAVRSSSHAIDADHLREMTRAVGEPVDVELVLDLYFEQ